MGVETVEMPLSQEKHHRDIVSIK